MIKIERITPADWDAIKKIYQQGIDTGNATFEKETKDWETWDENHLDEPRLLAKMTEHSVGWTALSNVSNRCIYGGVAEASIYIAANARGKGIGTALLAALVEASENNGIWTLQCGIFPENKASIALCKKCGFREVGIRKKLGKMDGQWRDVLLMERRSNKIGI